MAPIGGSLVSDNPSGMALTDLFTFSMQDWSDLDNSFVYRFGYYTSAQIMNNDTNYQNMIILSEWNDDNYVQTILPEGSFNLETQNYEIILVAFVQDTLGAITFSTLAINVFPYSRTKRNLEAE